MLTLSMLFMHYIGDFVLQGNFVANAKCKKWWHDNASDYMYRHDYIAVLINHAFCWTFCVMLPVFAANDFQLSWTILGLFILNAVFHAVVDDMKANRKLFSLVGDQLLHVFQIIATAGIMM